MIFRCNPLGFLLLSFQYVGGDDIPRKFGMMRLNANQSL